MTELTELEICKRIAEIEGYSKFGTVWGDLVIVSNEDDTTTYNPLTDDALCFKLIKKYRIDITYYSQIVEACYQGHFWEGKDLNAAVCLVLIEAHNEG